LVAGGGDAARTALRCWADAMKDAAEVSARVLMLLHTAASRVGGMDDRIRLR
jgi:hypothetical protein